MPVCQLLDVSRSFRGVQALSHLSLTLEGGRTYGLLGPNGAGKTTALRIMLGLLRPDSGGVQLFGGPATTDSRLRVGYVPETRALPELARVEETLVFVGRMRGSTSVDAKRDVASWLERMDLGHRRNARIDSLSNGERQKVQLTLAFLGRPDLLLLDEPLTALDPTHQESVLEVLRERVGSGATVLLATHRLWEAEALVEHVVLLDQGRKLVDSPLAELLNTTDTQRYRIVVNGGLGWLEAPGTTILSMDADGSALFRTEALSQVLARAAAADARVLSLAADRPSLHELFLAQVGSGAP